MPTLSRSLSLSATVALVLVACSAPLGDGPTASVHAAFVNGSEVDPAGTGAVYLGNSVCTAVLIDVDQILTAGHCVSKILNPERPIVLPLFIQAVPNDDYAAGQLLWFSNSISPVFDQASKTPVSGYWFQSEIVATEIYPVLQKACKTKCNASQWHQAPYASDLAIVTFKDPVDSCFGNAATFNPAQPKTGDVVQEGGYGCEDPAHHTPGHGHYTATKDTLADSAATLASDSAKNYIDTWGLPAGVGSLCPGDSGGPLFKGWTGNGGYVVGINHATGSLTNTTTNQTSDLNAFGRTDTPDVQSWIQSIRAKYPRPATPPVDRGQPSDDPSNPVANFFPFSSVFLTADSEPFGCTGVILSSKAILTAGHCKLDATTQIHYFRTDTPGSNLSTATGQVVSIDRPTGIVCDQVITDSFPATCAVQSNGASVYADLAVLNLVDDVPSPYVPALLGAVGSYPSTSSSDASDLVWQVGATETAMTWAPAYDLTGSDAYGALSMQSVFGNRSDSGGPLFIPAPVPDDPDPSAPLPAPPILIGIASGIGSCRDQCPTECDAHTNTFTSVVDPVNQAWLMKYNPSLAPAAATFGAAQ